MSSFLRKHKNKKSIFSIPSFFFILHILPSKENDFIKWSQILLNYGIEVKFLKPSTLNGVFNLISSFKIKNIFQISSVVITLNPKLNGCLFTQYSNFLKNELELELIKNQKVKIIAAVNKGRFFHAKSLNLITNLTEKDCLKTTFKGLYIPLYQKISILNVPFCQLLFILKKITL